MSVKTIVTNMAALQSKYGAPVATIKAALPPLLASDRTRGIITTVVDLSDRVQMARYNAPVVTQVADQRQNKAAIDGVFNGTNPNFLMILGGPDIIPHQLLTNPLFNPNDTDPNVPSDLPYACSAGYSLDPATFTGPTRNVGRLPDVTGSADPSYLARLLAFIITLRPKPKANYQPYFGLSTAVWQQSTQLSLTNIFGNAANMKLSPPLGPTWTLTDLGPMSHFVNCHGSSNSPTWSGESPPPTTYPAALTAAGISQRVTPGTIVTAECCYGAQLYTPPAPGALPICNTYLLSGAAMVFGSTNIAYGPATGNSLADLITQYVLINMLTGTAAGDAVLQARQQFVRTSGPFLSPTALKTLAQFILLGDPSVAPVSAPPPAPLRFGADDVSDADRQRRALVSGLSLETNVTVPVRLDQSARSAAFNRRLMAIADDYGLRDVTILSFASRWKGDRAILDLLGEPPNFHLIFSPREAPVPAARVLTVREERGEIVTVHEDWQH